MPSHPDRVRKNYESLEVAYEEAVIGKHPPTLMAVSGAMLLGCRPELAPSIMPNAMYFVSARGITKVEE